MAVEDFSTLTIVFMILGVVLASFGGGALAAYLTDSDRRKKRT